MSNSKENSFDSDDEVFDFYGDVYHFFDKDMIYRLSIADRLLINREIDSFVAECREANGEDPDLSFPPVITLFAPRLEQYGFELKIADHHRKVDMEIHDGYYEDRGMRIVRREDLIDNIK